MLGEHPIDVVLLATDLESSKQFYAGKLGLEILNERQEAIPELRSRGVEIQEYDMPGLKTVDGVADLGFARMAWIIDPHNNALAIMQLK
jgi:hypothetical protein